jgi:hypothetical protein
MLFVIFTLIAAVFGKAVSLEATPIGYLLTYSSASSACPASADKSYKISGSKMGVCIKVTPAPPDYAQSVYRSACSSPSGSSTSAYYTQTWYMSTNCAADSVIRSETKYASCSAGVASTCTSNSAPWNSYKSGYLELNYPYGDYTSCKSLNSSVDVTAFTFHKLNTCDTGSVSGQSSIYTLCRGNFFKFFS